MSLRVDVKDYGAVGDGIVDDTDAINAAIDAVNITTGAVFVSRGTYAINENGLHPIGARVRLVGDDKSNCILKLAEPPRNHFVRGSGNGWEIHNLTIDANSQFPSVNAAAINVNGINWLIRNCNILGIARIGIGGGGNARNWGIIGNRLVKPDPSGNYVNFAINMTHAQNAEPATDGLILNNNVSGSGIGGWLTHSEISGNRVAGSRYGSGIWSGFYPNSNHLVILNNTCFNGFGQNTVDQTITSGFEIWAPDSRIEGNVAHNNAGSGFVIGGQRTFVRDNDSYDNGQFGNLGSANGFGLRRVNANINADGSTIRGNRAYDTHWPNVNQTQQWGCCPQPGLQNLTIEYNNFNRNERGAVCDY